MSNPIILELRQLNAENVIANGDYSNIMLQNNISIEENDIVEVKNAFIDTSINKGSFVNIGDDIDIIFKYHIFATNWNTDGKEYSDGTIIDGMKYVLCDKKTTTIDEKGQLIQNIQFETSSQAFEEEDWCVDFVLKCSYLDVNSNLKFIDIPVPSKFYDPFDKTSVYNSVEVNIIVKEGSFTIISPDGATMSARPIAAVITKINSILVDQDALVYEPILLSKTINIKKNSYNCTYFAKLISELLTKNDYDAENNCPRYNPTKNAFLFPSTDLISYSDNYYFVCSESNENSFQYVAPEANTPPWWVGSSQVSLNFDESSSRFYWDAIHMPMYSSTGTMAIYFIGNPDNNSSNFVPIQQNSGIFWNSITSSNPKYSNLFQDILNFKNDDYIPRPVSTLNTINGQPCFVSKYNWNINNHTGGLSSIDDGVLKTSTFQRCADALSLETTITEFQSIYAESLFNKVNNSGYFKIAVDSVYYNTLLSDEYKQTNISAIVSRYYENNNYCSGSISDSIPYIHRGAPITINNFRVRILSSTNEIANDIGQDNTIYLQITKANQVNQNNNTIKRK